MNAPHLLSSLFRSFGCIRLTAAIANWDESTTRTQAVYTRLSADTAGPGGRTRSIVLSKLDKFDKFDKFVPASRTVSCGELQLRLKVNDLDNIDPQEWVDWITSAPQCISSVQIETTKEPEIDHSSTWECRPTDAENRSDQVDPE